MELSVKTETRNNKFILNPNKVREILNHFEGQEIELRVRKWKNDRTSKQNRWFHKACAIIADHNGDTPEDVKGELKRKYLERLIRDETGEPKLDQNGEFRTKIVGTSELNTEEFAELQNRVIEIGHFLGLNLEPE